MRVYTSESRLRDPVGLFREIASDAIAGRELAWQLFARDIQATYRQSFLGIAWLFLPPLLTAALWVFLNQQQVLKPGETGIAYPVYVLIGTATWAMFSSAVLGPLDAIKNNEQLIAKARVPLESLATASLARAMLLSSLQFIPVASAIVWYDIDVSPAAVLVPLLLLVVALLGFTFGLLLLPLGSLYHDFRQSLPILMQFLMYLSPVIYAPPANATWQAINRVNPMSPLLISVRELIVGEPLSMLPHLAVVTTAVVVFALVAWIVVRLSLPILVERMSA